MSNHTISAVSTEIIKIRKSRILLATVVLFIFIPLMMGLMLFVSQNPELAAKLGLIGTKAKLFGENDWPGYSALVLQLMASVGLIGFGFVTSWIFGREYTDKTLKDMLALPVKRSSLVHGKMITVFICCLLLSFVLLIVAVSMGLMLNIPGGGIGFFILFGKKFALTAVFTFLLCTPVAYLACYSKGIVAPLGFVILTMIMAQFTGLLGIGPYFPWAVPGLFSVSSGEAGLKPVAVSYILLFITFVAGYYGTIRYWNHADHN